MNTDSDEAVMCEVSEWHALCEMSQTTEWVVDRESAPSVGREEEEKEANRGGLAEKESVRVRVKEGDICAARRITEDQGQAWGRHFG